VGIPLVVETFFTVVLAPLFIFQIISLLALGTSNASLFNYFGAINEIRVIQVLAIPIILIIVLSFFLRFAYLEIAGYVASAGPTLFGQLAGQTMRHQQVAQQKMGFIWFAIYNAFEFGVRAFFVATLALYAVGGPVLTMLSGRAMNFGEAIISSLFNIPLIGWMLQRFIDAGLYSGAIRFSGQNAVLETAIVAIYSVVAIGVISKTITRQKS
jgi:hypothetical protein